MHRARRKNTIILHDGTCQGHMGDHHSIRRARIEKLKKRHKLQRDLSSGKIIAGALLDPDARHRKQAVEIKKTEKVAAPVVSVSIIDQDGVAPLRFPPSTL